MLYLGHYVTSSFKSEWKGNGPAHPPQMMDDLKSQPGLGWTWEMMAAQQNECVFKMPVWAKNCQSWAY